MLAPLLVVAALANPAAWPPRLAAYVAAVEAGDPSLAPRLVSICERESNCLPLGAHPIDAHLSRRGWRSQVRLGHLDPSCQPYQAGGWATRGAWGLSAASHWPHLPPCYQPQILDIPLVSARVAAGKLGRCKSFARGWCHSVPGRVDARMLALAELVLDITRGLDRVTVAP